jgi:hypothetical protein
MSTNRYQHAEGQTFVNVQIGEDLYEDQRVSVEPMPQDVITMHSIDDMLEQYEHELKKIAPGTFGAPQNPVVNSGSGFGIIQGEALRNNMIDEMNRGYGKFLQYVQTEAQKSAEPFRSKVGPLSEVKRMDAPNMFNMNVDVGGWVKEQHKLRLGQEGYKSKVQEYKEALDKELKSAEAVDGTSVAVHVARNLQQMLDQSEVLQSYDATLLSKMYGYQDQLMEKIGDSYSTFYSWLLEQWNQNIKSIGVSYQQVQKKLELMFDPTDALKDLRNVVGQYDTFLDQNHHLLPLEFKLSSNPRRQWRDQLTENPDQCLRLIDSELHALAEVPSLRPQVLSWQNKIKAYDSKRLQKVMDTRNRLKRRMEDAVDTETMKVYKGKWSEFTDYLYQMGIGLQSNAAQHLEHVNTVYNQRKQEVKQRQELLDQNIYGMESRLAILNTPWASLLEKQKRAIQGLIDTKLRLLCADEVSKVYGILSHLKTSFESK